MNPHQTDIDNFSGDASDLYSVTHANPVFSDEKEISHHGHNHVLQGHGDASGQQAGKRHSGTQLRRKSEDNYQGDGHPHGNTAQEQELIPPASIVNVAQSVPPPHLSHPNHRPPEHPHPHPPTPDLP